MSKTVLVTGANGYIGNAVARAFVRAGWKTYGLIRSSSSAQALEAEEILPVIGTIDDHSTHQGILSNLPPTVNVIVSTTENADYVHHYENSVALLRTLAASSTSHGVTPLVIFTSGVKDYGKGLTHGHPQLKPHTESSPRNAPAMLNARATNSIRILDNSDAFPAVLVRPTHVHGRSASYFGTFFQIASAVPAGASLPVPADPNNICNSLHVDDCGDAYVAIALHADRSAVQGQVFNISPHRYETLDDITQALVKEYGIKGGVAYEPQAKSLGPWPPALIDFPQWVSSDKLRALTGWTDRRPLFAEGLHTYRLAYEAAVAAQHENVSKTQKFIATWKQALQQGN